MMRLAGGTAGRRRQPARTVVLVTTTAVLLSLTPFEVIRYAGARDRIRHAPPE